MTNDLNKYLQPENAPVSQDQGMRNSYKFDAQTERNAIYAEKIKSINLTVATGTLTIGGTVNTLGKLEIFLSTNTEIAQLDNNGITLFGTTALQYYDTNSGSYIASLGPGANGTAYLQTAVGVPFQCNLNGNATFQMGASGNGTVTVNGMLRPGTVNLANFTNGTISTSMIAGTATNLAGTLTSPTINGTATYAVNASTASLSANNQFSFQTLSGTPVIVIRAGNINYYFTAAGTF